MRRINVVEVHGHGATYLYRDWPLKYCNPRSILEYYARMYRIEYNQVSVNGEFWSECNWHKTVPEDAEVRLSIKTPKPGSQCISADELVARIKKLRDASMGKRSDSEYEAGQVEGIDNVLKIIEEMT